MNRPEERRETWVGDGAADQLEYLMRRFGPQVQRIAYYYLRDLYLAEDVAQEVFYRVYRDLDKFRGESSYYTWIYRITVNLCRDYLRSAALRRLIPGGQPGPGTDRWQDHGLAGSGRGRGGFPQGDGTAPQIPDGPGPLLLPGNDDGGDCPAPGDYRGQCTHPPLPGAGYVETVPGGGDGP